GLLDKPGERKVHATPIPLGGGIGIWAGVVGTLAMATLAIWGLDRNAAWASRLPESVSQYLPGLLGKVAEIWMIVACGTVLMILGLIDDRRGLPWWVRLGVEVLVATFCVVWQGL